MKQKKKVFLMLLMVLSLILTPMQQATVEAKTTSRLVPVTYPKQLRISDSYLTLKVGETKKLSVKPVKLAKKLGGKLVKVTSSTKKVKVCKINKKALTTVVKGRKAGSAVVKLHVDINSARKVFKCKVKVIKNLKKYDISNWKFKEDTLSFTYDGKPHRPELVGVPKEVEVIWSSEGGIDAGRHLIVASFKVPEGYEAVPKMMTGFVIHKAQYDTSNWKFKEDTLSFTYDGNPHRPELVGVPKEVEVIWSSEGGIDAGKHIAKASFKVPKGYENVPNMMTSFVIHKAQYDTSNWKFKEDTLSFTYDGKLHRPELVGVPKEVEVIWSSEGASNIGTHTVKVSFGVSTNYEPVDPIEVNYTIVGNSFSGSSGGNIGGNKPIVTEKPSVTEKPVATEKPSVTEEPVVTETPSVTEKPTSAPEEHIWGEWEFKDEEQEERKCSHCEKTEVRVHPFKVINVTFEDDSNGKHIVITTYLCDSCLFSYDSSTMEEHKYCKDNVTVTSNQDGTHVKKQVDICEDCGSTKVTTESQNCEYSNWQYSGNNTDSKYCQECNYAVTREHEHEEAPDNLEFTCKSSNNDDTHLLEASYLCGICQEIVIINKNEACEYEITYSQTGINDTHIEESDCKICQAHKEKEGTCIPTGELKVIKVYSQIYEYYDCELCGDWCQRKYHTEHVFNECEYRNEDTHISYCICVEERKIANHEYTLERSDGNLTFTCDGCGDVRTVADHEHGYDTVRNMDLMTLIFSPAYKELINKSQISNPSPSPDDYCSRYEFRCQTCGIMYFVYYDHDFVDGICTRTGYCGGISQNKKLKELKKLENLVSKSKPKEVIKFEDLNKSKELKFKKIA